MVVPINILVVDDQENVRNLISDILNAIGYDNVSVTDDGTHAYRKLVDGNFDFVISDWNMPNMTGIQLLKAIRRNGELKHLPVLLITGVNQKHQVMEAAKAGVDGFIAKPFSGSELKKKMALIIAKKTTQKST